MSSAPVRFRDPRSTEYDFLDSMLVRCPRCERIAHFERRPCTPPSTDCGTHPHSRLVCRSCGLCRDGSRAYRSSRYPNDCSYPPLWLRTDTRHGELWAYNLQHLDLIRRFVAADLRERAPWYDHGQKMTLVARLPAWIKSAKNRDEVLRAVDRLRATVIAPG
ncbi:hypothetical protein OG588_43575 [Streptomyces prunicolor]|uniref:hypothetical protein n=1 Tax=Streptomyces prunicolor TaxID=67348 RepID=UPI00386A62D5|nr:hypothetical protein OG588_43575 [Streptomyces prunicolor]